MFPKFLCFILGLDMCRLLTKPLPAGQVAGGTYNMSITSSGIPRWYLISIPPFYEEEQLSPVILSYHSGLENATQQMNLTQMSNPYFNNISFVIYPQGINDSWQGIPGDNFNDIKFTSDILDQIEETYWIDPLRIWATGKSDGAGFCNTLACDRLMSWRIAAFAPVSGAFYINTTTCDPSTVTIPCNNSRPIPMIEFHGANDTTIAYEGGLRKNECLPSIPHFIQEWAVRDGLSLVNTTSNLTRDTLLYSYGKGIEEGLVTHVFDTDIGHDWASTLQNTDNSVPGHHKASYNATPIIIEYFQKYSLLWPR